MTGAVANIADQSIITPKIAPGAEPKPIRALRILNLIQQPAPARLSVSAAQSRTHDMQRKLTLTGILAVYTQPPRDRLGSVVAKTGPVFFTSAPRSSIGPFTRPRIAGSIKGMVAGVMMS